MDINTIYIVGPTASGKSALAMRVAEQWNGEIVCADSQTIRKGMNIGTAKPSVLDQNSIPHHILDIVEPFEPYSVARFKTDAQACIRDIHARGKIAVVVGGSGLYIDALFFDFNFRPTTEDQSERTKLEALGVEKLQQIIRAHGYQMPNNDKNPRHLIRVIEAKGVKSQDMQPSKNTVIVGLEIEPAALRDRLAERAVKAVADGLVEEVAALEQGLLGVPHYDAIAYKLCSAYLHDQQNDTKKLIDAIAIAESQYAKKQRSWFRRNQYIQWFKEDTAAFEYIKNILH